MYYAPDKYDCLDQSDGSLIQNYRHANLTGSGDHQFDNIKPEKEPQYPQYQSLTARLDTFRRWPLQRPDPFQLAQAGLYYLGSKDRTVCYNCGGGLSVWEPNDDPELEHKRLYPHCGLVKQTNQSDSSVSTQYSSKNEPISCSKQDQCQEDLMKSVAVQSLLEFGYAPENIKKAVDRLTIQMGKSTLKAIDLMAILDCTEDEVACQSEVSSKSLKEENERLRDMSVCKICMDNNSCIVFLPCGHMVCCARCAPAMRKCPVCRVLVQGTVKPFMA